MRSPNEIVGRELRQLDSTVQFKSAIRNVSFLLSIQKREINERR